MSGTDVDLIFYNTQSKEKKEFVPGDPKWVTMYVCGPTVYDYAHIGNFRPAVVFDMVFRVLRYKYGEEHVLYSVNFTDVDDKINNKANNEGSDIDVVTNRYIEAYNADAAALGVIPQTFQPRATEAISEIIALIERLIEQGAAYVAEGHVMFDTHSYDDYGKFSRRSLEDLLAGARVDVAPYKKGARDFVLWKPSKEGEPSWPSPWSDGRPGWHIECTAMINESLGLPIDIHGGGSDLVFPHHENEVAQGVCSGISAEYARIWMHNGMLNIREAKMSKSTGETLTAHGLLQHYPGEVLRWAITTAHYRAQLEWQESLLEQSKKSLDRLYGALWRTVDIEPASDEPSKTFLEALGDDLNTPRALAELFAIAGRIETGNRREQAIAKGELLASAQLIGFLNLDPNEWFQKGVEPELRSKIESLLEERIAARANKDWDTADSIRDELTDFGVEVMDTPKGYRWRISSD